MLYASTCKLISVLTRSSVFMVKCVAPIHDLSVPCGCSTVALRVVIVIHGFELTTVDRDDITAEQLKTAAEFDKLPTNPSYGLAIILAEVRGHLEIWRKATQ